MIDVSKEQLIIILDILNRCVPDCEVRAFGSRYKWTAKDYSDLDLVIVGEAKLDWRLIEEIKDEFEESDIPFRVDVLDWNAVSPEFRGVIEQGYEVIQKRGTGKKAWKSYKLGDLLTTLTDYHAIISQEKIASILSTLHDKINLNIQTNKTLEAIARTVFKEWFVNFNFPGATGEMEESELGLIPKGWGTGKLGNIAYIKHGYAFKGEYFSNEETENILLTPGNFRIGGGFNYSKLKYYKGEYPAEYVLCRGDLIVTMTDLSKEGDTLGYSALVPAIEGKKILHNQHIGKVEGYDNNSLKLYLYWVMQQSDYRHFILGGATGTTVKHTSPSRICDYKLIVPSEHVLHLFEESVQMLIDCIEHNYLQTQTLTQIRDSLLPKLMDGDIEG